MKLTADSGSTKTKWLVSLNSEESFVVFTQGINPFHMSVEDIEKILHDELLTKLDANLVDEVYFYGAGCTLAKIPVMEHLLRSVLKKSVVVEVGSDLLGAAKALCGTNEGIACILGTGANSGLYDGHSIVKNVSPMGYILGDEGSGAVIGKTLVGELYKGNHRDFIGVFEREMQLTQAEIIQKVYCESMPNRFLASLTYFVSRHIDDEKWLDDMVTDCFRLFFQRNIAHYNRKDLQVNFVGSVAYFFQKQLKNAANLEGFKIGSIMKEPF